jgi:hypothetical protein
VYRVIGHLNRYIRRERHRVCKESVETPWPGLPGGSGLGRSVAAARRLWIDRGRQGHNGTKLAAAVAPDLPMTRPPHCEPCSPCLRQLLFTRRPVVVGGPGRVSSVSGSCNLQTSFRSLSLPIHLPHTSTKPLTVRVSPSCYPSSQTRRVFYTILVRRDGILTSAHHLTSTVSRHSSQCKFALRLTPTQHTVLPYHDAPLCLAHKCTYSDQSEQNVHTTLGSTRVLPFGPLRPLLPDGTHN